MTIKAVIWDIGGVLVRTEDWAPRRALAQRMHTTPEALERQVFENTAQLGQVSAEQHWHTLRLALGLDQAGWADFYREFFAGDRLDLPLIDHIRSLRPRYRTAVLSNALSDLRRKLAEWGIADAFDAVVVSAEEGLMKPNRRIYQRALERLGVAPHEAVFIDDAQRNIDGAQAAGLHSLLFHSSDQAWADLQTILSPNE